MHRNASPNGSEHEPQCRAAGSIPGVPSRLERIINQLIVVTLSTQEGIWQQSGVTGWLLDQAQTVTPLQEKA